MTDDTCRTMNSMKAAIILDDTLPAGLLANAAACLTTGLIPLAPSEELYGPAIEGSDCTFPAITKIPLLILRRGKRTFEEIIRRARDNHLPFVPFTHEAQSTTSYDEYVRRVEGKPLSALRLVGIGLIGQDALVTKVAGDLPMLR